MPSYCSTISHSTNPLATHGMVTSPNHLATQAGLDILRRGGTAVDAAVAAAAVLAVVYPHMCTLGGDSFWLVFNAGTGELRGLNASGRAGSKATIRHYRDKGYERIPARGVEAANTVPGAVSGWMEAAAYSRSALGSPLSWEVLLESARDYAEGGFPVSPSLACWSRANAAAGDRELRCLQRFPGFAQTFMPYGRALETGVLFRQPALAATLRTLASEGGEVFYRGSLARRMVAFLEAHGGLLTAEDFAGHHADWVEPISVNYRGMQVFSLPPNTQGMASLEILNILDRFDVASLGEGSADYCHLIIEATKESFLDRDAYLSDPAFTHIPLDWLLSERHGREQAARIDMARAAGPRPPLDPKGDTVWLGAVDGAGNAVSLIQSIYYDFGSGIVPDGTGVLLQNRGCFFSLDPNHVNCLLPGKRTFHTLTPAILLHGGRPRLVYGTMGGEGQPQTQAAMLTRMVDFGMSPQEAVAAPRWLYGRSWGAETNDLKMESRFAPGVMEELRRRGHAVTEVADYTDSMGHAGAILIRQEDGVLQGAADPRGDGLAAGW